MSYQVYTIEAVSVGLDGCKLEKVIRTKHYWFVGAVWSWLNMADGPLIERV